jgi:hypothetical protein
VKVSGVVERICSQAYEDGLTNSSLEQLIDILTRANELDQGSLGNMIRNLYPVSKVPDDIIVKVLGSLGHGQHKPSYACQASLLKWLAMVYDVLENQKVLSRFYGILFNLLDTISVRYVLFAPARQILIISGRNYATCSLSSHDVNTSDHSEFKSCGFLAQERSFLW